MGKLNRREFVVMAAAASQAVFISSPASATDRVSQDELVGLTLSEASRRIHEREITSTQLTQALLDRIGIYNPKINAFITVMRQEALAQAAMLDKEAKTGKFRSALHGIPIALKDNIDTEGTRTTAASAVFDDRVPDQDAYVVSRLKEAGAVLIGKTNMHEFAAGGSSASTYFGPVRNPWALDRIPAGSSGGSAAAIIAGMAYGALGTDIGCSVRMPAAYCSIVGLKPTYGLVSIRGIIPLIHSRSLRSNDQDSRRCRDHAEPYDRLRQARRRKRRPREGRLRRIHEAIDCRYSPGDSTSSFLRHAR